MDQISNKKSNRFFSISMFDDIYTHPVQIVQFDWFIHSIQMMIIDLINRWFVCVQVFSRMFTNFNRISICKTLLLFTSEKNVFAKVAIAKLKLCFLWMMMMKIIDAFKSRWFSRSWKFFFAFQLLLNSIFFDYHFTWCFFRWWKTFFLDWIFFFFSKKSLNKFRDFQRKLSNGNGISIWLIISEKKTMDGWNEKKKIIENDQSIDRSIDQIAKFQCCWWWLFYYMQKAIKQQTLT